MRALSHIGMRRLVCRFSIEVTAVRGLESLNGLRLSVTVRKKETKDGAVRTMASRVTQGSVEFQETLFIRCHVYCSGGGAKPLKIEPRPFVVSVLAVDAPDLSMGKNSVDLSLLVRESLESGQVRSWDRSFVLSGKAVGGELVLKLGNEIIDGGGVGFYNQPRKQPKPSANATASPLSTSELKIEDATDTTQFEVVDKGTEILARGERLVSSEVVKQVVHNELDSPTQTEAVELVVTDGEIDPVTKTEKINAQGLDDTEETVTKVFLQMLELEDDKHDDPEKDGSTEEMAFLSNLGEGLGALVQTRDGGYLASMNPLDEEVFRISTPKLAMQMSRAFVLQNQEHASGFSMFQRLAALGSEELGTRLLDLVGLDELYDKTAEQIAFEGIASAIISGRNKERASSSAARSIAAVKMMATALAEGRGERILTGVWNVREDPVLVEEILTVSLQKMEAMAVEALKIQADKSDEEAMSTASPLIGEEPKSPLDAAASLEDWAITEGRKDNVTLLVIIQLRDPLRRNEAVGAPVIALIQAERVIGPQEEEEARFKVASIHMGSLKLKSGAKSSPWDREKQKLTATQWLVANGLAKAAKKEKPLPTKAVQDTVWSSSSRVVANIWLDAIRNPDVKIS